MKPYQKVPINDCGEALLPIPLERFAVVAPHPYAALGAPYGDRSPYFLRESVLTQLAQAQTALQAKQPGWLLQIFDAYRPIPVQQFMVDYTFEQLAKEAGLDPKSMPEQARAHIHAQVIHFWAVPSPNHNTPPPHSTGAAIDLTLCDANGSAVEMGSPIDELSPRSYPNHFANSAEPQTQKAHHNRSLLAEVMVGAGLSQHSNEWRHFSLYDQMLALQQGEGAIARYGSI